MVGPDFCERCNAGFVRHAPHQRFCSDRCKTRAYWSRRPKRPNKTKPARPKDPRLCAVCGDPYIPRQGRQTCCSVECRTALNSAAGLRILYCSECRRERLVAHRYKYCSPRCRRRAGWTTAGGLVYFIQAAHGGPIKIGRATDPEQRLVEIQTSHWTPLVIRRTLPGGARLERQLHARFAHVRLRGEWFEPTAELQALADVPPQQLLAA